MDMDDEQALAEQADRIRRASEAIMTALAISLGETADATEIMMMLGVVVATIARASGSPDRCMGIFNNTADGVLSGELLTTEN